MCNHKNWIKSPWTIALGTTIVGSLVSFVLDFAKDKPIFSTIGGSFVWLWNVIVVFLNLNIRVWWLILGVIVLILIIYIVAVLKKPKQSLLPDFIDYTEGVFKKFKWSWKWRFNQFSMQWEVSNLDAHCPECSTKLMDDISNEPYRCPRCNFISRYHTEYRNEIERLIIDNIDKGNYPKKQPPKQK